MGKKNLEGNNGKGEKRQDGNGQGPKYLTESGEEIEYITESLYDLVTLYFSKMKQYIDVIDMIDFNKGPNIHIDGCQMFLADMGRTLIKDLIAKFGVIYDTIDKEVGDIRVDLTRHNQFGKDEDTPLGAYVKGSPKTLNEWLAASNSDQPRPKETRPN